MYSCVVSLSCLYISLAAVTLSTQTLWAVRDMVSGRRPPIQSSEHRLMLVRSLLWFSFWPSFVYRRWT